jgi:hypothetical protein
MIYTRDEPNEKQHQAANDCHAVRYETLDPKEQSSARSLLSSHFDIFGNPQTNRASQPTFGD